jgi:hypothetical protein
MSSSLDGGELDEGRRQSDGESDCAENLNQNNQDDRSRRNTRTEDHANQVMN